MNPHEPATSSEHSRLATQARASAVRGRALLYLDLAAAMASEHVRDTFADRSRIGGWIVDLGLDGLEVLFLTRHERPRTMFRVTFAADGKTIGERMDDLATPRQLVIANAKRTALAAVPRGIVYNAIVIPPPDAPLADSSIEVYLMRAARSPGDIVIGVHWQALISADGARVLGGRAFSRSDETLLGSNGVTPDEILITDSVGEAPSEIHSYLSFKHGRSIDVITIASRAYWRVREDEIELVRFLDLPRTGQLKRLPPEP